MRTDAARKRSAAVGGVVATALALTAALAPAAGAVGRAAARGRDCAHPYSVSYVRGRLVGDTAKVSVQVVRTGRRYAISWHPLAGTRFCAIVLVEGQGQRFSSQNPSSRFVYTDYTRNASNGIKSLTATTRSA